MSKHYTITMQILKKIGGLMVAYALEDTVFSILATARIQ